MSIFIGFHLIRFIYHSLNPVAKKEFQRKKTERRIKADFPRYEAECRKKHKHQADNEFSTLSLEKEIKSLVLKIKKESNLIFEKNITNIQNKISHTNLNISNNETTLDLFLRNYNKELDSLYNQKNALFLKKDNFYNQQTIFRDELANAFKQKDEAFELLNECKDNIDSWHSKSDRTPWLFGNGGKKLPKPSLFGQSFGDLDSYKYDRDEAYNDVNSCKKVIGDIKNKISINKGYIDELKKEIVSTNFIIKKCKDDRTKMYKFKKEGINKSNTQKRIDKLQSILISEQHELGILKSTEKDFLAKKMGEYGVNGLENEVKIISTNKDEFIKKFDINANHIKRINEHRTIWANSNK